MGRVLPAIIEQSVTVFDGFLKCLGEWQVSSFRDPLDEAYSDSSGEFPVELTHISSAGPVSASWLLANNERDECEDQDQEGSTTGDEIPPGCAGITSGGLQRCYVYLIKILVSVHIFPLLCVNILSAELVS